MLKTAMVNRNKAEPTVLMTPPMSRQLSNLSSVSDVAVKAMAATAMQISAEWPSANQRPTDMGWRFSCINLRVTLSMAAIWSGSTAWRRPST